MAGKPVCWQCGASLRDVPRPIRRFSRCPSCRAELHVCRLCKHYRPGVLGECNHERAERVVDKTQANFCAYFRPAPDAHRPASGTAAETSRAALDALFGLDAGDEAQSTGKREDPGAAAERARRELERLFDVSEPAENIETGEGDS